MLEGRDCSPSHSIVQVEESYTIPQNSPGIVLDDDHTRKTALALMLMNSPTVPASSLHAQMHESL